MLAAPGLTLRLAVSQLGHRGRSIQAPFSSAGRRDNRRESTGEAWDAAMKEAERFSACSGRRDPEARPRRGAPAARACQAAHGDAQLVHGLRTAAFN